jgi:diadenylate cyclase
MLSFIHNIRLVDIIDIFLVAIIIYWILMLIRGTRAVQIMTGLCLLFFIFLASKQFGLLTFQWLVGNFLAYIIVIMVIIFQNEMRAGLAQIGKYRLFRMGSATKTEFIDELIEAIGAISLDRRGTIIILERDMGLKDIAARGIPIDGKLSYDLIVSITHPDSPLHDGAIVVSNERVVAAGVILPIIQEVMNIPMRGARHRAALSITYETDAVSIVVSEENGEISLCMERGEKIITSSEELKLILHRIFGTVKEEKGLEEHGAEGVLLEEPNPAPEEGDIDLAESGKSSVTEN